MTRIGEQCSNLGGKEKRQRVFAGIITFLLGAALALGCSWHRSSFALRIFVFPFFFLSFLCFLQAKERVCVLLAASGKKETDGLREKIADAEFVRQLKSKSLGIVIKALVLALIISALAVIL